ncbi:hypothetical protein ACSBR2_025745 [Camellia fascicularis]
MGYQVRFGFLEAGAYGVSQSRKHAFIWAASPEETPPEWPEPMNVFAGLELKISLNGKNHFATVRSTSTGAPFHAITVRDTIGDLPAVKNGASTTTMEIEGVKARKQADPESMTVKVRSLVYEAYAVQYGVKILLFMDIPNVLVILVYYSEQIVTVPLLPIEGKCELPAHIKLTPSKERVVGDATFRKKGKCKEGDIDFDEQKDASSSSRLATLDIFAGCGGLSDGLRKSRVSLTKWAIEYEEAAGEAFNLNHPDALMIVNNCNVILSISFVIIVLVQWVPRLMFVTNAMVTHYIHVGDEDDCISTPEAAELAAKLDEKEINNLPRPGQVDFINGFSGMNRFNHGTWSKVQCEMILAFLFFAEYFRPKFFLLENVRNFVSYNKGQTFRLTLASLLEMGYQVRFGILEAGAYSVSQSRKRAFIWAASPEETPPEWPEPMRVFACPELKI